MLPLLVLFGQIGLRFFLPVKVFLFISFMKSQLFWRKNWRNRRTVTLTAFNLVAGLAVFFADCFHECFRMKTFNA